MKKKLTDKQVRWINRWIASVVQLKKAVKKDAYKYKATV